MLYGGIFDYANKSDRLIEVNRELEDPAIWNKPAQAQALGKERAELEKTVNTIKELDFKLNDAQELFTLAVEEDDKSTISELFKDILELKNTVDNLEFQRMFSGKMDA